MIPRIGMYLCGGLCGFLLWLADDVEAQIQGKALDVNVHNGLLSVDARSQSLESILLAVAQAGDFDLVLEGDLSGPVSYDFRDKPLAEGIQELTRNQIAVTRFARDPTDPHRKRIVHLRVRQKSPTVVRQPRDELAELLDQLLNAPDKQQRMLAARRLMEVGSVEAVDALSLGFSSEDPELRVEIISGLTNIGNRRTTSSSQEAVHALGEALEQEHDPSLRTMLISSLETIATPAAKDYLRTALTDRDDAVRDQARRALEMMGN